MHVHMFQVMEKHQRSELHLALKELKQDAKYKTESALLEERMMRLRRFDTTGE